MKLLPAYTGRNHIYHTDALSLMRSLGDKSVDAYITDLPYGSTGCSWDVIIPFAPTWAEVKRTLKPRGVFVTTASQPFTSLLTVSNLEMFRYEWIWSKSNGGGFLNANRQPLKRHENILVFYSELSIYNPQLVRGKPYTQRRGKTGVNVNDGGKNNITDFVTVNEGWRYPKSILEFDNDTGLHPTQKPLLLLEYLVDTYTRKGDLVVDFCCGSGTTAAAARKLGRDFICGDSSLEYVEVARKRLAMPYTPNMFASAI